MRSRSLWLGALFAVAALIACEDQQANPAAPAAPAKPASAAKSIPPTAPVPNWTIGPIIAHFVEKEFMTDYTGTVLGDSKAGPVPAADFTFTWRLELTLVDRDGAPDPGVPSSGAAVDLLCNNDRKGIPEPFISRQHFHAGASYGVEYDFFGWYHPDPGKDPPLDVYHCNHLEQGPKGHQGLITLTVSDSKWQCTATYKGTKESGLDRVKQGIASEPVCKAA
jgi:hypothetical protein